MPGHAGSPFWAAVDFDSEGDEDNTPSPNSRLYLDPWDTQAYGLIQGENTESSHGEIFNHSASEPQSGNFYYVPTKNYDSEEEMQPPLVRKVTVSEVVAPEYVLYGRKKSRAIIPDHHSDMPIYGDRQMRFRRRSMFLEEPVYEPHPLLYEPTGYGSIPMLSPPPPGYLHPQPISRVSHPDYVGFGKPRRPSRLTDPYEHFTYESLSPDYEDWARPFPKAIPENFHLSRYGHLQIDYSFSWSSLDRLIRNK